MYVSDPPFRCRNFLFYPNAPAKYNMRKRCFLELCSIFTIIPVLAVQAVIVIVDGDKSYAEQRKHLFQIIRRR